MSDQKPKDLYQNESEHDAAQKRRKLDENKMVSAIATTSTAAAAAAAAEPKSITNIYYDCLERIFDFLDLESLLNVAGTCKRLQIAAAAKFGDQFGKSHIALHQDNVNEPAIRNGIYAIHVYGLKLCFPFLRCFGAKILDLRYDSNAKTRNDNLERYISQYCANTLTRIGIWSHKAFPIGCFAKPFKNVMKVVIGSTNLENHLPKFVDWFPNMRHLTLEWIGIDEGAIAVHFPLLKELVLTSLDVNRKKLTLENAAKLLHANLQLQSLDIHLEAILTLDEVLNMISKNSSILELEVRLDRIVDVSAVELNSFASKHPLMEKLDFHRYQLTADDAIMFIRQLNALKQFEFKVKDQPECDRLLSQLDSKWKCEHYLHHYSQTIEIKLSQ